MNGLNISKNDSNPHISNHDITTPSRHALMNPFEFAEFSDFSWGLWVLPQLSFCQTKDGSKEILEVLH